MLLDETIVKGLPALPTISGAYVGSILIVSFLGIATLLLSANDYCRELVEFKEGNEAIVIFIGF